MRKLLDAIKRLLKQEGPPIKRDDIDFATRMLKRFGKICGLILVGGFIVFIAFVIICFAMFAILESEGTFDDVPYTPPNQESVSGPTDSVVVDYDAITELISNTDMDKLRESKELIENMLGVDPDLYLYPEGMSAFSFLRMYSLFAEICADPLISAGTTSDITPGILMAVLFHENGLMPPDLTRAYHADTGKNIASIGKEFYDPYLLWDDGLSYAQMGSGDNKYYAGLFGTGTLLFGERWSQADGNVISSGRHYVSAPAAVVGKTTGYGIPVLFVSQVESGTKSAAKICVSDKVTEALNIPNIVGTDVKWSARPMFAWSSGIQRPSATFMPDVAATAAYYYRRVQDGVSIYNYTSASQNNYVDALVSWGADSREALVASYFENRAGYAAYMYGGNNPPAKEIAAYYTAASIQKMTDPSGLGATGFSRYNYWFSSMGRFKEGMDKILGTASLYEPFCNGLKEAIPYAWGGEGTNAFSDPFFILTAEKLFTKTALAVASAANSKFPKQAASEVPEISGFTGSGKIGWSGSDANFDGLCDVCGKGVTSDNVTEKCTNGSDHDIGLTAMWPANGSSVVTSILGSGGCTGFHPAKGSGIKFEDYCDISLHAGYGHFAYDLSGVQAIAIADGVTQAAQQKSLGNMAILYVISDSAKLQGITSQHTPGTDAFNKAYIEQADVILIYCHLGKFLSSVDSSGLKVRADYTASDLPKMIAGTGYKYVTKGTPLGTIGKSGTGANAVHLHLEIKAGGSAFYNGVTQSMSNRSEYIDFLPFLKEQDSKSWIAQSFGNYNAKGMSVDKVVLGFKNNKNYKAEGSIKFVANPAYITGK